MRTINWRQFPEIYQRYVQVATRDFPEGLEFLNTCLYLHLSGGIETLAHEDPLRITLRVVDFLNRKRTEENHPEYTLYDVSAEIPYEFKLIIWREYHVPSGNVVPAHYISPLAEILFGETIDEPVNKSLGDSVDDSANTSDDADIVEAIESLTRDSIT